MPLYNTRNISKAKFLLETGVNPNIHEGIYQNTPLHAVIMNENSEFASDFLAAAEDASVKIDFTKQDKFGKTLLMAAVRVLSASMVKSILRYDKAKLGLDVPDKLGRSPLHYACLLGHYDIVQLLTDADADMHSKDKDGKVPADYLDYDKKSIETVLKEAFIDPRRDETALQNAFGLLIRGNFNPFESDHKFAQKSLAHQLLQKMTGRSILEKCLSEQTKIRELFSLTNGDDKDFDPRLML